MPMCTLSRSLALSGLFIKEQLKEPVALFWMIISPVVTYYLLAYSRGGVLPQKLATWKVHPGSMHIFLQVSLFLDFLFTS